MENNPQQKINPRLKKIFWAFVFLALVFLTLSLFLKPKKIVIENLNKEAPAAKEEAVPDKVWREIQTYTVSEGDIPAEIFQKYGQLDANDTETLLAAAAPIYDFSKLKIGQKLHFYFDAEEKFKRLEYERNTENLIVAEREGNNFQVREEKIAYAVFEESLQVIINTFLYKDAVEAGLSEATILEIADIFSFDVDFTTEIQKGDQLKLVYEKRELQGEKAPDGRVLAAKFVNGGKEYFAYYFGEENTGSHYDEEGHELKRQFLRAPLSYRRITSGYSAARFHPITKTVSAHYQIDYAAPLGTPVVATAEGTVTSAGWEGGWGKIIRLNHKNGYTTHYGHLSAFAQSVKPGAEVLQGQVIGFVGSTGWSTGAHLDYGLKLNGSPVNPLTLKLPKGPQLDEEKKVEFEKIKEKYNQWLL